MGFGVYLINAVDPPTKASLDVIAASKTDPLIGYNYIAVPSGMPFSLD
jgi:hypothetical protein